MRPTSSDANAPDDAPHTEGRVHARGTGRMEHRLDRLASSERRTDVAPETESLAPSIEVAGRTVRLDAAHPTQHELDTLPDEPMEPEVAPQELLASAEELAELLRRQCADLERREQRLHHNLALMDAERRATRLLRTEFDELVAARESELSRLETQLLERSVGVTGLEAELAREREVLAAEWQSLADERSAIQTEKIAALAEVVDERERMRAELQSERDAQLDELSQRAAELDAEARNIARMRDDATFEVAALREAAESESRQERVLLDSRLRFQQDHLEKSRGELEEAQTEFRWEQQAARTWLEQELLQSRLLRGQLDQRRGVLEAREQSIVREQDLLLRSRRAQEDSLSRERERLTGERAHWEHERDVARADLRRQQDLLALHAENLETRRQRLDSLRAELEETNRKTLETRLAVEEAYSQLSRSAGPEETRMRVDEARAVMAEYYRGTRDSLVRQRQEIEQMQERLMQQRQELQAERESLAAWGLAREQKGIEREAALGAAREELDAREREARGLRERWLAERQEAESVIRDLLDQLEFRGGTGPAISA
jgi:hypothetical protein